MNPAGYVLAPGFSSTHVQKACRAVSLGPFWLDGRFSGTTSRPGKLTAKFAVSFRFISLHSHIRDM